MFKIWNFIRNNNKSINSKRYDELNSVSFLLSINNQTNISNNNNNKLIRYRNDSFIELLKYKVSRGDLLKFELNEISNIIRILSKDCKIENDKVFFSNLAKNYKNQLIYIPHLLESICSNGNLIALQEFILNGYKISEKGFDLAIEVGEFGIMKYLYSIGSPYTELKLLENVFLNHCGTKICSVFLRFIIKEMKIDISKCNKIDISCYYYLQDDLEMLEYLYHLELIEFNSLSELIYNIQYPINNTVIELINILNAFISILKRYIYNGEFGEMDNQFDDDEEDEDGLPIPPISPDFNLISREIKNCYSSFLASNELDNDLYSFKKSDTRIECLLNWYIELFKPYGILTEGIELVNHFISKYFNKENPTSIYYLKKIINFRTSETELSEFFKLSLIYSNFDLLSTILEISNKIQKSIQIEATIKKEIIFENSIKNNDDIENTIIQFITLYTGDENHKYFEIRLANLIFEKIIQLNIKNLLSKYYELLLLKINSNDDEIKLLLNNINLELSSSPAVIPPSTLSTIQQQPIQLSIPFQINPNEVNSIILQQFNNNNIDFNKLQPYELCKYQRFQEMFEIIKSQKDTYHTIDSIKLLYKEIGKRCVPPNELLEIFINEFLIPNFKNDQDRNKIINGILKKSIQFGYLKNLQYLINENDNLKFEYQQFEKLLFYSIKFNDIPITKYLFELLNKLNFNDKIKISIENYLIKFKSNSSSNQSTTTMIMFLKTLIPNLEISIIIKKLLIQDLSVYYLK